MGSREKGEEGGRGIGEGGEESGNGEAREGQVLKYISAKEYKEIGGGKGREERGWERQGGRKREGREAGRGATTSQMANMHSTQLVLVGLLCRQDMAYISLYQ